MSAAERKDRGPTVGVFDSGFGGLTVLRELLPLIPNAHYIYLGDTARLPYGAKSQATIARYAVESARFLALRGCDYLVIACNTATALALDDIRAAVSIPVLGVIEPGAQAAKLAIHPFLSSRSALLSSSGALLSSRSALLSSRSAAERPASGTTNEPEVLVLATTATVQSHAYHAACATAGLHATEVACPLLVPLVEEGWTDHPVTREVLRIYLEQALNLCTPQAVLLGCTHYPLIAAEIERTLRTLGSNALIIDSAAATAAAATAALMYKLTTALTSDLIPNLSSRPEASQSHREAGAERPADPATFTCYATDSTEKFARLGSHFLGQPIPHVHLLDLGG